MSTDLLLVLARILMGGAFLVAGVRNARSLTFLQPMMAGTRMPFPRLALFIGIGLQVVCGGALALGLWPAYAAAGLIVFVVMATMLFHPFWVFDGQERAEHVNGFISNTALTGSFLFVFAASI